MGVLYTAQDDISYETADAPKSSTISTLKKLGQVPYYAYYASRND
ncbi:hypothetical protein PPO43_07445 [Saprospira sp. CCB-QB6]|nr:hypothetical protein [Saprospira sp. CCB-QB6]WCL82919.1 hypothetical protein PPO43_07445 [Saprospira sp. CCB-QB6]